MILKRVGEIQEAPESQAKKKYEARMLMKKIQSKQIPTPLASQANNFPKLQVRRIEDLTSSHIRTMQGLSKLEEDKKQQKPRPKMRKVRLLTRKELHEISEHSQAKLKNIRILSKSQLNRLQLKKQLKHETEMLSPVYNSAQIKKDKRLSSQANKSSKIVPFSLEQMQVQGPQSQGYDRQLAPNQDSALSIEDILRPNQIDLERHNKFGKLVNETIAEFDQAIKGLDTALLQKCHVSIFLLFVLHFNKTLHNVSIVGIRFKSGLRFQSEKNIDIVARPKCFILIRKSSLQL